MGASSRGLPQCEERLGAGVAGWVLASHGHRVSLEKASLPRRGLQGAGTRVPGTDPAQAPGPSSGQGKHRREGTV